MFAKVLSTIVVRNTLFFNLSHPKGKSIHNTVPSKLADTISIMFGGTQLEKVNPSPCG